MAVVTARTAASRPGSIRVEPGLGAAALRDRAFTACVNAAQRTAYTWASRLQDRRRRHWIIPPTQSLLEKLRSLGLRPERFYWGLMTLSVPKAELLIDAIEKTPPTALLDVGSGNSTALFAALAERYDFEILALENHQGSIDYVAHLLEGLPFARRVTLQKCCFVRRRWPDTGKPYRWYDADLARVGKRFDFAFVDGPLSSLVGREGFLPEVLPYLDPEAAVFLDDVERGHEAWAVRRWGEYAPGLRWEIPEHLPRIARIRLPGPR